VTPQTTQPKVGVVDEATCQCRLQSLRWPGEMTEEGTRPLYAVLAVPPNATSDEIKQAEVRQFAATGLSDLSTS